MSGVVLLTSRHLSEQTLDDSEHLADSVEDPARELVLIIDREPAVEDVARAWVQDLSDLQLAELLLAKDAELLGGLWSVTEVLIVSSRRLHLPHDFLGVSQVRHIKTKVSNASTSDQLIAVLLEAFHALQVNDCLDDVEALK